MKNHDLDTTLTAYLACALWSSTDDAGEPLDASCDIKDIAPASVESARIACAFFLDRAGPWLADMEAGQIGHCLWLNRNGHGSGFWDEETCREEWRKVLSDKAHALGTSDAYVGDDGLIHLT